MTSYHAEIRAKLVESLKTGKAHFDEYFRVDKAEKTEFLDENSVIVSTADNSTIRAYRYTEIYHPLSIFRSWALAEMKKDFLKRVSIASRGRAEYDAFHAGLCIGLKTYWAEQEKDAAGRNGDNDPRSVPNYGRQRKLIDLFMKHVVFLDGISTEDRINLRGLVNVPLDKYTLMKLSGVCEKIDLPKSKWTMGIVDEDNYAPLQELIRAVAKEAGVSPIDYDVYAWNGNHTAVPSPQKLTVAASALTLVPWGEGRRKAA
ncbi:hypothetical protein [Rhizobium sp.]